MEKWTQFIGRDVIYRRSCPDLPRSAGTSDQPNSYEGSDRGHRSQQRAIGADPMESRPFRILLRFTGVIAGAGLRLVRNLVAWRRSLDIPGGFSMCSVECQTFERSNDWFPAFEETHGDRFG